MKYPPTPAEIREFLTVQGWTAQKAADKAGLKSDRTVRKYLTGEIPIPYAVWFTWRTKGR